MKVRALPVEVLAIEQILVNQYRALGRRCGLGGDEPMILTPTPAPTSLVGHWLMIDHAGYTMVGQLVMLLNPRQYLIRWRRPPNALSLYAILTMTDDSKLFDSEEALDAALLNDRSHNVVPMRKD